MKVQNKKYIIELAEKHTHYDDNGQAYTLYRVKGFNSLVLDAYGLSKLEEFKEKDLIEQFQIQREQLVDMEDALDIVCKLYARKLNDECVTSINKEPLWESVRRWAIERAKNSNKE